MTHVGVTATQRGLTPYQKAELRRRVAALAARGPVTLHHGDCIGGDEEADSIARELGCRTVSHPPENPKKRAFCSCDEILPEQPYRRRNVDIVAAVSQMFACPKTADEHDRTETYSGTWMTVRIARSRGVPVDVIPPEPPPPIILDSPAATEPLER
jgi:hypothetical protein